VKSEEWRLEILFRVFWNNPGKRLGWWKVTWDGAN
jgi:hypothetical protein